MAGSPTRPIGRLLELHGTADCIAVGLEDRVPLRSVVEPGTTFPTGTPHSFVMDRFADAFRAELAAFVQLTAGRIASPCTVADAVGTSWVAEACVASVRERARSALRSSSADVR